MRLEQLAYRLELAGLGVRGKDIFIHYMPAAVTRGLVLLPSLAGDPINWEIGSNWRRDQSFQVIVRDANIPDGYNFAKAANDALIILSDTILPAMDSNIPQVTVRYIRPKHDIIVFPRSPTSYFEFSTNFEAAFAIDVIAPPAI